MAVEVPSAAPSQGGDVHGLVGSQLEVSYWTRSGPAGARSVGPLRGAGFAAVAGVPAAPQEAGGHNEAPRGVAGAGDPLDQEVRARRAHILDIVGDDPEPELVTSGLHCLASRGPAERTSTIGVSAGPRSCSQVRCPRR
jgi:hypothetical protein